MNFIINNIKWVMLVSGMFTATMLYGVFAPQAALESMFGVSFSGQLENLIIRSWSALVGLMGVVLIVGYISPALRVFSLAIAAASKLIFVALLFTLGAPYLSTAALAVSMDCIVVLVALCYLLAVFLQSRRMAA